MNAFRIATIWFAMTVGLSVCFLKAAEKKEERYGSPGPNTVTVTIDGPGVEKPGIYFVERESELLALVEQAKVSKISNGRFTVTRTISGEKHSFALKIDRSQNPPFPSFRIIGGDFVYAAINLP